MRQVSRLAWHSLPKWKRMTTRSSERDESIRLRAYQLFLERRHGRFRTRLDAAEKRAGNPVVEMIVAIGTSISSLAHVTGRRQPRQMRRAARHST